MFRLKTLSVLAGLLAALAVSAAPASAWWEATGTQSKGPVRVINHGKFVAGEGTNTAVVECPTKEIEATWSIQTKGQIKQHEQAGKQEQTNFGPHLYIKVTKWGTACTAVIGGASPIAATITSCTLQEVQQKESFVATGAVATECVIKAGNCEVLVPAGMEKEPGSNEGFNVGLGKIELSKLGSLNIVSVSGVKSHKPPNTPGCPLTTNQPASLTGLEFETEGAIAK